MFREMRRKDRRMEDVQALELIKSCDFGVLSTVDENGYPYGVPISYFYDDNKLYFHSAKEGKKLDNIRFNNKVSFSVIGKTEILPSEFSTNFESAIVFGIASELTGEEKHKALMGLVNKYSSGYIPEGLEYAKLEGHLTSVYKIEIEHISGKIRG